MSLAVYSVGIESLRIRIFATFPLQEIGLLAHRADEDESVARTIMMSTGLQVAPEADLDLVPDKPADRALIMYVFSLKVRRRCPQLTDTAA